MSFDVQFNEKDTNFVATFGETMEVPVAVGGTTNYDELKNKPKINSVELSGNVTLKELGIQPKGEYIDKETDPTYTADKPNIALKSELPTDNSQLTNGAGYQTANQVQTAINKALGNITQTSYSVVSELPTIGEVGVIYLIDNNGEKPNIYDEYIYVNNAFEKIGTTEMNLSNYATKTDLENKADVVIPYKASYTDEEKTNYGAKIFSCFDSTYTMLRALYVSVSGLLVPYTGRVNDSMLSFGMSVTDITNGVHFVDYLMTIDTASQTLQNITIEPTIELVDDEELSEKQDTLVSGTNIKTINGTSILGSGNIEIGSSGDLPISTASATNSVIMNDIDNNRVFGKNATAMGSYSAAQQANSVAMGYRTSANGNASVAMGLGTNAYFDNSVAMGVYNYVDTTEKSALIVGNGTGNTSQSNAFDVKTDGTGWFAKDIYVGSASGKYKDNGSKKIATEEYVNVHGVNVLEASESNIIDFNELTEAGYYLIKNANTSTTLNSPITDTGTYDLPLEVEKTTLANGDTDYEQLVEGGIVYRKYTNSEWYDWGNVTEDMYEMTKAYTDSKVSGGGDSMPIGNIISYMGTIAPSGYLICDGSTVNISDYSDLAEHFQTQFGSKNYFGGDGTTTFAVPDLRNEFLRGYHGNATNQFSGDVGVHQDATQHIRFIVQDKTLMATYDTNKVMGLAQNKDTDVNAVGDAKTFSLTAENSYNASPAYAFYTSRPTNVAVLFCIKY